MWVQIAAGRERVGESHLLWVDLENFPRVTREGDIPEGSAPKHAGRTGSSVLRALLGQCWRWALRGGRGLETRASPSPGNFQKCKFSGPTLLQILWEWSAAL